MDGRARVVGGLFVVRLDPSHAAEGPANEGSDGPADPPDGDQSRSDAYGRFCHGGNDRNDDSASRFLAGQRFAALEEAEQRASQDDNAATEAERWQLIPGHQFVGKGPGDAEQLGGLRHGQH